jgi:hypothetical protein
MKETIEMSYHPIFKDVKDTIESLLDRPEMFCADAKALESQFWVLLMLLAPYGKFAGFKFNSEREFKEKFSEFQSQFTSGACGLSSIAPDIKECSKLLRQFYCLMKA